MNSYRRKKNIHCKKNEHQWEQIVAQSLFMTFPHNAHLLHWSLKWVITLLSTNQRAERHCRLILYTITTHSIQNVRLVLIWVETDRIQIQIRRKPGSNPQDKPDPGVEKNRIQIKLEKILFLRFLKWFNDYICWKKSLKKHLYMGH